MILKKNLALQWKHLLAEYTINRIEKKDISCLIEKGLSILPKNPDSFFIRDRMSPLVREFIDSLYRMTPVTMLQKSDGSFLAVLDSAKPRNANNLVKLFKRGSSSVSDRSEDVLVTVYGNGFKPVMENGKWSVKISKVFKVEKSSKKTPDTVKEILSASLKGNTFLSSKQELELFKKAKLIKVEENCLPEICFDEDPSTDMSSVVDLRKLNDEKRLAYGVVYEPNVVDADGHEADENVIEETAHNYLADYSNINLMHEKPLGNKVQVVESYIAPTDFFIGNQHIKKGSWVMVVKIHDDDLWEAVKSGVLNAFSLEGKGVL